MVVVPRRVALTSLTIWLMAAPAAAQSLEVVVTPLGSAAKNLPLPVGAAPNISVTVRNRGSRPVGPIALTAKADGFAPVAAQGWRVESGNLVGEIARLGAGDRVDRPLRLKVERAPTLATKQKLTVDARVADGSKVSANAELNIADCVGAYREKLAVLRAGLLRNVRDTAEKLRGVDPSLPGARLFPTTGARSGDIANAERLAAALAVRHGGDPQMATEWFQFIIQRWTSELTLYSNQSAAPGLCANNYYQIAGYRQGLMPITNRIESIRVAADRALAIARTAAKSEGADETLAALTQRAIKVAMPNGGGDDVTRQPLEALAAARDSFRSDGADPNAAKALSLIETAAWLMEADQRGQALKHSIEQVLTAIGAAHKESCVCAF
jgi:hypothetical protein